MRVFSCVGCYCLSSVCLSLRLSFSYRLWNMGFHISPALWPLTPSCNLWPSAQSQEPSKCILYQPQPLCTFLNVLILYNHKRELLWEHVTAGWTVWTQNPNPQVRNYLSRQAGRENPVLSLRFVWSAALLVRTPAPRCGSCAVFCFRFVTVSCICHACLISHSLATLSPVHVEGWDPPLSSWFRKHNSCSFKG